MLQRIPAKFEAKFLMNFFLFQTILIEGDQKIIDIIKCIITYFMIQEYIIFFNPLCNDYFLQDTHSETTPSKKKKSKYMPKI